MTLDAKALAQTLGVFPKTNDMVLKPYSFNDTKVIFGAPPFPLVGLEYVMARHVNQQTKRFQCLSGRGVFASNVNQSGIIELGFLRGSPSQFDVQLAQLSGVPFPIVLMDLASGGSSQVVATGCQLTETPEWRREALPGINVYTFETTRLFVAHGIQLPVLVT